MPALAFILANWRILSVVVGIVAVLGGGFAYVEKVKHDAYVSGHDAGYSEAQAKCDAEKAAQEAANRRAMEQAAKALDALTQKLQLKEGELDDRVNKIDLAADAAPDALTCGLDADSVRRLSTFQ